MEREIGRLLVRKGWTLAVAESCTGGLLGFRVTRVSGSSRYFAGGIVAYANRIKTAWLGVPAAGLAREGAVSAGTARAMARGVRERMGVEVGAAVTGIAGPGGGGPGKPVGLVFVALAYPGACVARRFVFEGDRAAVRQAAAEAALRMLKEHLQR